jgi:hypothetical protein
MGFLEIISLGLLIIFALVCGVKIGQVTAKGKPIEWAEIKPIEAIKERRDKKEAEREQDRISTIMANLEAYDGTANGQKDVPRG